MARTFRRHRTAHPISELNVTNLIDLGFTLLIIFMIATPLINQEQTVPVNLPFETSRPQTKDKDNEFQTISIDRKGNYFFGTQQVTFEDLSRRLKQLSTKTKPPVLSIRGDLSLQYQQVMKLIDEVRKYNLTRISLDTQTGAK